MALLHFSGETNRAAVRFPSIANLFYLQAMFSTVEEWFCDEMMSAFFMLHNVFLQPAEQTSTQLEVYMTEVK